MEHRKYQGSIRHLLSMPFIWALLVPLLLFDLFLEIYHRVCFPLYRLRYINRSQFFRFNRARLPYLTVLEKINCTYCSYANGLISYALFIAAETESYWCGIQNQKDRSFSAPIHHRKFLEYGDKKNLLKKFKKE